MTGYIDNIITLLLWIVLWHKAYTEWILRHISLLLTPPRIRTELGNTIRSKTISLAVSMFIMGLAFLLRNFPFWDDIGLWRWVVWGSGLVALAWNQYWCIRTRILMQRRLDDVMNNTVAPGEYGLLD